MSVLAGGSVFTPRQLIDLYPVHRLQQIYMDRDNVQMTVILMEVLIMDFKGA